MIWKRIMNQLQKIRMDKINILSILNDHLKTFYSVKSPKVISFVQILLFVICPVLPAVFYTFIEKYVIKDEYVNIIIAGASILAGFLFNLLALFYSIKQNILNKHQDDEMKIRIINESITNTAFNIVVSIFLIICIILCNNASEFLTKLFTFLSIYLSIVFVLTLFMILKRMYIIIKSDQ